MQAFDPRLAKVKLIWPPVPITHNPVRTSAEEVNEKRAEKAF